MKTAQPLRTAAAKQAAQLAYTIASERDANKRAKLAHSLCQLLHDLDCAATMAVGLADINREQSALLQAVEATGIRVIATDEDMPIGLEVLNAA